jgi:predicted RNA binding protein YcfA (HicA-like mRNA interferase family)
LADAERMTIAPADDNARRATLPSNADPYNWSVNIPQGRAIDTSQGMIVVRSIVPVKVRDLIKTLEKEGWHHVRTSGDHRVFRNLEGRITVVSGKLGDVLRRTGIKEPD